MTNEQWCKLCENEPEDMDYGYRHALQFVDNRSPASSDERKYDLAYKLVLLSRINQEGFEIMWQDLFFGG